MRLLKILSLIVIPLFFTGCYYTSQSYNNGKLLDPGDSKFTGGVGVAYQQIPKEQERDSAGKVIPIPQNLQQKTLWRQFAINYQLGVEDKYPFGGGAEIGIHFEYQLYKEAGIYGKRKSKSNIMPCVDFNTRLGFKDYVKDDFIYQHNLELGWTTGLWVNNGWFIGYAGGWEFRKIIPYYGVRFVYLPSKVDFSKITNSNFWDRRKQKMNVRVVTGATFKLKKMPLLPDLISPEFSMVGPHASPKQKYNIFFHVGFSWTNGL